MRINTIKIDQEITSLSGLNKIELNRLEAVVALVGKNGSGKSRVLNCIENNIDSIINLKNILNGEISGFPKKIQAALKKIEPYKELVLINIEIDENNNRRKLDPNNKELNNLHKELNDKRKELLKISDSKLNIYDVNNRVIRTTFPPQNIEQNSELQKTIGLLIEINPLIEPLRKNFIKRLNYSELSQLQQVINSKDDEANSFEKLIDSVTEELMFNELGSIYKSSLRFLNKLPHQLVSDWIDSVGNTDAFQSRIAYKRYESLKLFFEKFIGKKLTWDIKNVNKNVTDNGVESLQQGVWKINDRVFDYSEFSDGEKTLFAYVIMFFLMSQNKTVSLKDSILIIDEPELHLHPDAEIELLNGMKDLVGDNGQLFIATHSLNILSHLEYEEVFVVKDGVIGHPTTTNQRNALIELLSLEERIDKLSEFLTSISDWTFIHFIIECFSNPDVIEIANENDPQVKVFKEIIKSLYQNENKKTLLLDFGAGKGRLFEQAMKDNQFKNLVDYTALEIMDNYHRDLKDKGIKKIYNSYLELEPESLDFVVLCNVLHEIPIQEWRENLNKIIDSLKENGFLLIMEAKYLKKGEKIGNSGFILLNHEQINHLFNVNDSIHISENQSNITNVLLSKKSLKEISKETILDTLKLVEMDALNSIINLRKSNQDKDAKRNNKFGRLSAFYSQLHINAKIAYSELVLN